MKWLVMSIDGGTKERFIGVTEIVYPEVAHMRDGTVTNTFASDAWKQK